jgi:putative glutamine amidotransferase
MQFPGTLEVSHSVRLEADSMIARILGADDVDVNSFHHQCVDRLGKGLRSTGVSEEGIVEVYEHEDHPYLLAVQWHPERMRFLDRQMLLFRDFVKASCESKIVQS